MGETQPQKLAITLEILVPVICILLLGVIFYAIVRQYYPDEPLLHIIVIAATGIGIVYLISDPLIKRMKEIT